MPRPPLTAPAPPWPAMLRVAVVAVLVLAATALAGAPAGAHPFLRGGGEVPVDSLATVTLDLAHGCGSEADGMGEDTLEVALEVPPWLRVVAVAEQPAYRHELEVVDGRTAVVTWTAAGASEPAPAFELDVVATGTVGETRHLAVFQGCENGSHRWIGTPQEPADEPAVNVRLVAADPARPAPPETPVEDAPDEPAAEPASSADEDQTASDDAAADAGETGSDDGAAKQTEADSEVTATTAGDAVDDREAPVPILAWVALGVVVLAGAGVLARRRAGRPADTDGAGS